MNKVQTKTPPPARYSVPFKLTASTRAPAIGAMMEKMRPQNDAMPQAVPEVQVSQRPA
jgi:hypothetical protein